MTLEIQLLGVPHFIQNGQPVTLNRRRSVALLAYLVVTRQPQLRESLVGLLWPEFDSVAARANLRRDLSWLRKQLPDELLLADRQHITFNPNAAVQVDVYQFEAGLAAISAHSHPNGVLCDQCAHMLQEVVELNQGEFMAGFSLPDCAEFDEWLFFRREQHRRETAVLLQHLVEWHSSQGSFEEGISFARRWLSLDLLHEPAHRALMRLYAQTGHYAAAIRQYHLCAQNLETDLAVEPEEETKALLVAVQTKQIAPPALPETAGGMIKAEAAEEEKPAARRHNIPALPGSFVGRREQIKEIQHNLTQK